MEKLTNQLKALADKNRLLILKELSIKNCCVKRLSKKLGVTESSISQHLKKLREAGIIVGEKQGYFVHYRLKKDELKIIAKEIENL